MVGKAPGTAGTLHSISCRCKAGIVEGDVAPAGSFWLALLAHTETTQCQTSPQTAQPEPARGTISNGKAGTHLSSGLSLVRLNSRCGSFECP